MAKKTAKVTTVTLDQPYVLHGVIYPAGVNDIPASHLESDLTPGLQACVDTAAEGKAPSEPESSES